MNYKIIKLEEKISYYEKDKKIELQGYAFINNSNLCMVIVYGENRRDIIIKVIDNTLNINGMV